jgi:ComEC/Rec2-related protein
MLPISGFSSALAIGDQQAIPAEQWRLFRQTGVTHLMSISGLHVTMVAALFAGLVGWLWRRSERLMLFLPAPKAAIAAGWLAALGYSLLAGFAVPTQRTLYMLSVVALALWSGRNLGVSRSLLLALLLVLLLDPWAVLSPGFWLSFAAVGLLFFVGTGRIGAARGWRAALANWGATQWAVTVGTLPLAALPVPAVLAGFAAGQRGGDPAGQLRDYAAGAGLRRHSLAAAAPFRSLAAFRSDGLSRMAGQAGRSGNSRRHRRQRRCWRSSG